MQEFQCDGHVARRLSNYFSHHFWPPLTHSTHSTPHFARIARQTPRASQSGWAFCVAFWNSARCQCDKEHQRLFQIQVLFVCLFVARLNPLERLDVGCWSWMLVDVHEAEESHFRHLDTFVWSLEWACLGQLKRLRRQPATVCRLFKPFINNLYIIL